MSYAEIFPKNKKTEELLLKHKEVLFDEIFNCIKRAYGVPDSDIIVEMHQCTTIEFHKKAVELEAAPDAIVKINTNDVEHKCEAGVLRDYVVESWNTIMGEELIMECWIGFFDTWGCNTEFE